MSYPQNDTTANMYQGDNTRGMIPAQPVPVVAHPPPQMMYPVAYQPQAPPYVVVLVVVVIVRGLGKVLVDVVILMKNIVVV